MAWDTADHHLIILLFDGQHDDASLGLRGRGRFFHLSLGGAAKPARPSGLRGGFHFAANHGANVR